MSVLIQSIIFGATFVFKAGLGFVAPFAKALGGRSWLIFSIGAALIIFPVIAKHKGRQAVQTEVAVQAGDIKTKDANENLNLAVEGAKIQSRLEQSSTQFEIESSKQLEAMKKGSLNVEFENDAVEWANQPVPMSIRLQLNENGG
jgi:hypothetical protein